MVLIITQVLGANLRKSNVGFRDLNPTYKIGDRTHQNGIALSPNDRSFKVESIR